MWIPLGGGLPLEERQVWTGLQHRSLDHPVGNDSPQLLRSRSVFPDQLAQHRHSKRDKRGDLRITMGHGCYRERTRRAKHINTVSLMEGNDSQQEILLSSQNT